MNKYNFVRNNYSVKAHSNHSWCEMALSQLQTMGLPNQLRIPYSQ